MGFTPTVFVNDQAPALNATEANKLGSQYAAAVQDSDGPMITGKNWFYQLAQAAPVALAAPGVNTLRVARSVVPNQVTLSQIGGEIIAAGDAGSVMRLGIYADLNGVPGALLYDSGNLAADAINAYVAVASNLVLPPGVYWAGGVVQNFVTTSPSVRAAGSVGANGQALPISVAATPPAGALIAVGYALSGITGALPANWGTVFGVSASAPRIIAKVA